MSDETDAFQTILTDVDELLREKFLDSGFSDAPFVLTAVSQKNEVVIRDNMTPQAFASWRMTWPRPQRRPGSGRTTTIRFTE